MVSDALHCAVKFLLCPLFVSCVVEVGVVVFTVIGVCVSVCVFYLGVESCHK